ncbi:MAG: hypothetical protein Q8R53_03790 [Nanoarchaeota archaeon]|nr:hypothetical protein [Nanoarchaeota archaeon]
MYAMRQSYAPCCEPAEGYFEAESGRSSYSALETIAYSASNAPHESYDTSEFLPLPAYTPAPAHPPAASYAASFPAFFSSALSYGASKEPQQLAYSMAQHREESPAQLPIHREYHFNPALFLKPGKEGKFVGKAEEIRPFIEEAFSKMFDEPFPVDIMLSVLDEKAFRKIAPHPGTMGLSINRKPHGLLSEIFVLNGSLGRVLLTIGHELGHALSLPLSSPHDEEAKAYAFSLAWMNIVKEHNIAGLQNAFINEQPAENGLHNVAFAFVQQLLQQEKTAEEIHSSLIHGEISVPEVPVAF